MGGARSTVIGMLRPCLCPLAVIERLFSSITMLWDRGPECSDPFHVPVRDEPSRAGLIHRVRGDEPIRSTGQNHCAGEDSWC